MKRFFSDFESLDRFTLSVACFDDAIRCPHCAKSHQLISHGVIYKQRSMHKREAVGKRVFCSNRYQRSGCGRTIQLYVATVVPALHYTVATVLTFLSALLLHVSVNAAYQTATGRSEARQAWRWLNRLQRQLSAFRTFAHTHLKHTASTFSSRYRRLQLLLPALEMLFLHRPLDPCAYYQLIVQTPLF